MGTLRVVEQPETRYVVRPDGVSIAYQVWGSGSVDLLYAPGFVSHLDLLWADPGYTKFFARMGSVARVIAFDKPGTGCSDPIPHMPSLEERALDMRFVLDAAGSGRAAVMGFSESGPASALLAANTPERVSSLILYGTFPAGPRAAPNGHLPDGVFPDEWKEFGEKLFTLREHWGEGMIYSLFAPSATYRLKRRAGATFERASASPAMVRSVIESAMRADVRDILPSIRVPTLVLHRTDESMPIQLGRELAERIPGARFVEMPGSDHLFWFGDYDGIASEIERFLTGGRATRAPDRALTTVLFTDIVDSTRRAAELGDAEWRSLLIRHNATVHEQVESYDGRVVKLLGDGTLAAFDSPAGAVRCAIQLRESLGSSGLPIRAGVHTGECEMIGEDIGGMAVHIGARVSALAQNGEILVSSTVADLVIGSGLHFEERGSHELKGIPGQWRLMAVAGERLPMPTQEPLIRQRAFDRAAMRLARRFPGAARAILDAQRQ